MFTVTTFSAPKTKAKPVKLSGPPGGAPTDAADAFAFDDEAADFGDFGTAPVPAA